MKTAIKTATVTKTVTATKTVTKTQLLLEALKSGEQLTAKEIAARYDIANPTATISDLRLRSGYAVYANRFTEGDGTVTFKYRLGTPRRSVVAAGYRALAAGLVTE